MTLADCKVREILFIGNSIILRMRGTREWPIVLAMARAIQTLAGTAPRKEAALRADIFMSWLNP
jgi:hypothetical protein